MKLAYAQTGRCESYHFPTPDFVSVQQAVHLRGVARKRRDYLRDCWRLTLPCELPTSRTYWAHTAIQNIRPSMQMLCERRAYLNDGRPQRTAVLTRHAQVWLWLPPRAPTALMQPGGRATTVRAVYGPEHDWLTAAGRSASDHPMLPNKGTVERRHHSAEDDANDDPGPQIRLLGFVHLMHRQFVLFRKKGSESYVEPVSASVSCQRNRAYLATVSGEVPRPGGLIDTPEAWPALLGRFMLIGSLVEPNRAR